MSASRPTGVVLLNMGGPEELDEVGPFLERVLGDPELVRLPFQRHTARLFARLRAKSARRRYAAIGGGSPMRRWTEAQAEALARRLDEVSPATAPHRCYPCFRYSAPTSTEVLRAMRDDGVRRAVAFSQYPQYSCTSTGSSLHDLWRAARELGLAEEFDWTVIDRFPTHGGYVRALAGKIAEGLAEYPADRRDDVVLLFSAHSLPRKVIDNGDPYLQEVTATVRETLRELDVPNRHVLAFQDASAAWQGPDAATVLRALAAQGHRDVLVVGVAFTSDHLDTLWELDIELAEAARAAGVTGFRRAPALNDDPAFVAALADIVVAHLESGERCSRQFALRCVACVDPDCRTVPGAGAPSTAPVPSPAPVTRTEPERVQ
ncbi:ferrochelatase [Streptoalloteichus hindustanus]|uniref:Coproporphyrin III ferrochelatase n=1 Tax=Streptoalloteichus hindustanus TaxID=2017 RepID=A0A1M5PQG0_STRHI|nr:ferrochelatase [Streptoalloteichus hindustanus]SHH04077.1 ferrochelatase [Streptoalloteichus hindustanus]